MARFLLVGTAGLDLIFGLSHMPHADEEMRASSLRSCRGGNAANTAVVLARLGHDVEFLGVLADAPETSVISKDFDLHGVNYQNCPIKPGLPPTSSIYLSGASRSIVHYRDLPELDATDFIKLDFMQYDHVHFEGRNIEQLALMLSHLKMVAPSLPISIELEKKREGMAKIMGLADLYLCSKGYAHQSGYEDAEDFLRWMHSAEYSKKTIVAWGEQGAYGWMENETILHTPAFPPANVIDTLGAGDTFNAGVLDRFVDRASMHDCLQFACQIAGKKCGAVGFDFMM